MTTDESTLARLVLVVQRLLDAELLSEAQSGVLLDESKAALHAWQAGHVAARHHVHQVELSVGALLRAGALSTGEARAVIDVTSAILATEVDDLPHARYRKDNHA